MRASQTLFHGATGTLRRERTIHMPNQQPAASDAATWLLLSAHTSYHGILYLGPFLLPCFFFIPLISWPPCRMWGIKVVRGKWEEKAFLFLFHGEEQQLPTTWDGADVGEKCGVFPGFSLSVAIFTSWVAVFPECFPTLPYRVTLCFIHQ